jgi:uncharacterized protein YggE
MKKKTAVRAALAALAVLAALTLATALSGCQTKVVTAAAGTQPDTVTTVGTGEALATPDQALVDLGVTVQNPDAKAAMNAAAISSKAVLTAIEKAGVAKDDIQTTQVMLDPQYSSGPGSSGAPKITGYQATVNFHVTIRKLADAGKVIEAATTAGANVSNGPQFVMSASNPKRNVALAKAVEDARSRAETMAKAVGKQVGNVVTMTEQTAPQTPGLLFDMTAKSSAAGAQVPVQPGQLTTSAQATVTFELR